MGTEEDWPVEQTWSMRNTHWHAYVEHTSLDSASPRAERLERAPEEVLTTPTEVAAWLEVNLRSATKPEETGKKRAKDERDFSDSHRVHVSLASRGESIYTGGEGDADPRGRGGHPRRLPQLARRGRRRPAEGGPPPLGATAIPVGPGDHTDQVCTGSPSCIRSTYLASIPASAPSRPAPRSSRPATTSRCHSAPVRPARQRASITPR